MSVFAIGIVCLVAGYFAGREHLKYEVKTAAADALAAVRSAVKGTGTSVRSGGIAGDARYAEQLEILDGLVDSERSKTRPTISGRLKNKGTRTLNRVIVTVYFQDSNGVNIHEDSYLAVVASGFLKDSAPLRPNYVTSFNFRADRVPEEWDGKSASISVTEIKFED